MTTDDRATPEAVTNDAGTLAHTFARRRFLAGSAATAAGVGAAYALKDDLGRAYDRAVYDDDHGVGDVTDDHEPAQVLYTMCQQCQSFCTIKVALRDGAGTGATALVRKIAGNPYSPLTTQPYGPIPYDTDPVDAVAGLGDMARDSLSMRNGRSCLKGQAGVQIVHDRRRLTQPLKRVGPRGSGRWRTIGWEQALSEILDGADDLGTPGVRSWWAYAPEDEVMADWERVTGGELDREAFTRRWGDVLIDPDHPDLGPKSNLLAVMGGDRSNIIHDRFAARGLGTVNTYNHAGVCGIQHVIGNVRSHSHPDGKKKKRMYADLDHVEYLIVWGTEPLTANKGPVWLAPRITNALQRGMELVVVDPRLSKTAEKAHRWVPVQPGGDAALALGMARWIIDHGRYDERYLRCSGPAAAAAAGEPTWCDATHLVRVDDPGRPLLRQADLGGDGDAPMVLQNGTPVPAGAARAGDLDVDTTLRGPDGPIRVTSVFRLLSDRVAEQPLEAYAERSGVDVDTIATLADEFTSHGKRAAIMSYRGVAMHTDGYYTTRALNILNFLIGNHDWKGGEISAGATYEEYTGRYDLKTVPGANTPWGTKVTREKAAYPKSSLFEAGTPAKRRWFPLGANLCNEVLPSAAARYPYGLEALFLHRHSPVDSSPGGQRNAEVLADQEAIGLVVAFDVVIGDSSRYADYILPDTTYLERWGRESLYPNQPHRVSHLGQPVTRAFEGPRPVEQTYIDLLKAMGLPGAGRDAFPGGGALDRPEDYYLKIAANIAYSDPGPVPDAGAAEQALFTEARTRALGDAYDERAWRRAVSPTEWPKVVYVLNRGGRYEPPGNEYEGEWLRYRWGGGCNFYDEKVAGLRDAVTGEPFDGLPRLGTVRFADGTEVDDALPLTLINWKARQHGTHRTVSSAWLREVRGTNHLWMSARDARARGLSSGDRVRVRSASAEVHAEVVVVQGIRPGVVGADLSYGHAGYGAEPVEIDGNVVAPVSGYGHTPFDQNQPLHEEAGLAPGRGTGFLVNSLLRTDVLEGGGGLADPIAGGAAQFDTHVEVERLA